MKTRIKGLAAALLCGAAFVAPASAEVLVVGSLVKDKDVSVTNTIDITKDVLIVAGIDFLELDNAAEALTIVNQVNQIGTFDYDIEGLVWVINTASLGGGSVSFNNGVILGVNQDAGNAVKQANAVSFAFTEDKEAFLNAEVSVEQVNGGAEGQGNWTLGGDLGIDDEVDYIARIENAINNNVGVGGINQNAGNSNDQVNAVAIAVGVDGGEEEDGGAVVLAEADLGQFNSDNRVELAGGQTFGHDNSATIGGASGGAINFNHGIFGVNQAAGHNTNQANIVSFAGAIN